MGEIQSRISKSVIYSSHKIWFLLIFVFFSFELLMKLLQRLLTIQLQQFFLDMKKELNDYNCWWCCCCDKTLTILVQKSVTISNWIMKWKNRIKSHCALWVVVESVEKWRLHRYTITRTFHCYFLLSNKHCNFVSINKQKL